ncbi:MAG TPA: PRC-barrel domain-containing protein [Acidimicrobiia bacterium]
MSGLTRATELISRPVVTMAGDTLAEVKDVVYDSDEGSVLGFTLNRRGWLGKPLDLILAADAIASIGRDAIMIADPDVLVGRKEAPPEVVHAPAERNVIGNRVLTKSGTELGEVIDVVVDTGANARIVGYELGGAAVTERRGGRHILIPRPEQLAVSGEALIVPDDVESFVRDDLSGFGAAVDSFRARLKEPST